VVFIQAPTTFSSSTYFCHLRIPFPKDFRKLFVRYLKGKAKSRKGNDRLLNQSVGLDRADSQKRKLVNNFDEAKEWIGIEKIIIEKD